MKHYFFLIILSASLPLLAETSEKKDKRPFPLKAMEKRFQKLDTDQNGSISKDEFQDNERLKSASAEQIDKLFNRIDKNSDGQITRQEMRPLPMPKRPQFDFSKHGPLDFEAFSKLPRVSRLPGGMKQRLFKRLDSNEDQVIDQSDVSSRGQRRFQNRKDDSSRRINWKELDKNEDKQISFEEFFAHPRHQSLGEDKAEDLFESLDKDQNGVLSTEERPRSGKKEKPKN